MHRIALVSSGEERLPDGIAAAIRAFASFEAKRCGTPDELAQNFPDAEILWMFGPNLCLKPEALDRLPAARALFRSGSGLEALPLEYAKARGLAVYNTPESISESVAEHTLALLLAFVRQIPQYNARAKEGYEWGKVEGMDWHLSRRTLGLVGYGNIARQVEKMAGGFDMTVLHHDPFAPDSTPLEELLSRSDYVSVHCPLTPETKGLFNAERLALMRRNAILVNTSRGPVVDEEALADALDKGVIGGAALDVMCDEPPALTSRLLQNPRCIVTPHVAAFSADFEKNFWWCSVEKLRAICRDLDVVPVAGKAAR